MSLSLWQQCLARLQDELPATEFSMWIRPLQAELSDNTLALYAPNRFVLDWVRDKYLNNINGLLTSFCGADAPQLRLRHLCRGRDVARHCRLWRLRHRFGADFKTQLWGIRSAETG